jgi:uncharacterized damage-inducible protein DinB
MNPLTPLIQRQIRLRILEESIPRIKKCLNMLTEDQIWWSANSQTNSIANLILHLNGNVRQWLIEGIGNEKYDRHRNEEFSAFRIKSKNELLALLDKLAEEVESVTQNIVDENLTDIKKIQCFAEDGISIIIHVIEHFSYHTGQISLLTKLMTNADLGYYAAMKLD